MPESLKFKGATAHVDRDLPKIGEELLLIVEGTVEEIKRGEATLEVADAYELGDNVEEVATRLLSHVRQQFLRRDDERRGRAKLPIEEKLEVPSADELPPVDEDSGVAKIPGELDVPPHPDEPDFEERADELDDLPDPGADPFEPGDLEDGPRGDGPDEELEGDDQDDDLPDEPDGWLSVFTGGSVEKIPARLFPKLGPAVDRASVDDVLEGKVGDVKERLSFVRQSHALEKVEEAEKQGKARKGVLEAIGLRSAQISLSTPADAPEIPDASTLPEPDDEGEE